MAGNWKDVTSSDSWRDVHEVRLPEPQKRNALAAGLSSGVDDFQGLMYSAGAAASDAVGATGARDWLNQRADENQYESRINGRPDLERVEDQSVGSMPAWLMYQVGKQVPNIAGTVAASAVMPEVAIPTALSRGLAFAPKWLGGGAMGAAEGYAAKKAAVQAGRGMASDIMGGAAMNYAQGVGSLYQESVDGGNPDGGGAALLGGVPYGLTETLPEAMLLGRIKRGTGFSGNLLTRMGKSGASQAATGATSELLQNEMEMGYNGSVSPEEAASRRLNAGVAGGMVEGLLGSFGGIHGRRSNTPAALVEGGASTNVLTGQNLTPAGAPPASPITIPPPAPVPQAPPPTPEEQAAAAAAQAESEKRAANEQAWKQKQSDAEGVFLSPGKDGKVSPVDGKGKRLVTAELVKLHEDLRSGVANGVLTQDNYDEATARIRVALQEGDKSGVAAVRSDMQEAQRAFDKAQAQAKRDAEKAKRDAEKAAKQKAEDKQVTTQAVADNAAAAQAATTAPAAPVAPPAVPHVQDLQQAADVLLGKDAPTDTGAAQTSAAAPNTAAASGVPVSTGTDAQSGVSSAVVPSNAGQGAVATQAHAPVVFGKDTQGRDRKALVSILNPEGGLVPVNNLEGADPKVTTALQEAKTGRHSDQLILVHGQDGSIKALKKQYWDILRMARGLDEEGHSTRQPMNAQQIADALGMKSRSTVTKALNEMGGFGMTAVKQMTKQGNLAAKDDGVTAMEFNEDGTGQMVQATQANSVEDAVDEKRFNQMDEVAAAIQAATPDQRRLMLKHHVDPDVMSQAAADWDDMRSSGTAEFSQLNDLGKLLWYAAYKNLADRGIVDVAPFEEQQRAAEQAGIGIDDGYLQGKSERSTASEADAGGTKRVSGQPATNVVEASPAGDSAATQPKPEGGSTVEQGNGKPVGKPTPAVNKGSEATDVEVKQRYEYPADLGFPQKIVAGQRAIVDFMNDELSREELITKLSKLGLLEGELRSISNRMGGFNDQETGRITGSVAGVPAKPAKPATTRAKKVETPEERKARVDASERKGQLVLAGNQWGTYADTAKQGKWADLKPEQQEKWRQAYVDGKLSIAATQEISPIPVPIEVELKNSDGSTIKIKDAELEVRRIESKIQKLEALVQCLG
jgi:hypothetical protein